MLKSLFITFMTIFVIPIAVNAQPATKDSSSSSNVITWSSIDEAPKELLTAVKEGPKARFSVLSEAGQKMPLILVDLSPNECGANACTVQGYAKRETSYVKVLDFLTDGLPASDNFVTLANSRNQMPYLDFKTASNRVESVRARWCYDGKKYNFEKAVLPDNL
jgi:hypothetical protein